MPLSTTLIGIGIAGEQASRLGFEPAVPLDGLGTTQIGATVILPHNTNIAAGTSVGDTAFILPADAEFFQQYFVLNTTPTPALIYPPIGDTIDTLALNAAVTIELDESRIFWRIEEGRWVSVKTGEDLTQGTVTSVTGNNANGFTVDTGIAPTVAPIITVGTSVNGILEGDGTSAAAAAQTGTGPVVRQNSPSLVTPDLGTPSAINLANGTNLPVGTGISGLAANMATFLSTASSASLLAAMTDKTGTGTLVFNTSPALVTPNLGTPSVAVLTNATGLPISTGVSGLGANVATFLATPSSANLRAALTDETGTGLAYFQGGALGTPSSGVATNLTGLPLTTGVTGTLPIGNGGTGQITAGAAFDALAPTTTRGDLIFRNATTNARLAASTAGYLLQTNGAGTDPTYAGFLQAGTGATTRTWQDKGRDVVSIKDFGGVGDNATDNLTAFNAANTYLSSLGGGTILVPEGVFRVSGAVALSSKVGVEGTGQGSVIRTTSATADIFQPAGNQVISDLAFDASVTRTAGAAIKMDGVGQIVITRNLFTGMMQSVWCTNACSLIWIQTNSIYTKADTTAYGIRIDGPSAVGNDYFIQSNFIRSLSQATQPLAGIYIDRSGGTYMSSNSLLWCGTGLMLRAASGTTLTWTFSTNDTFDTCNADGINISASAGGTIKGVFFDSPWSSSNGQEGLQIANGGGTVDGIEINNPRIFNNSFYGIDVAAGPINVYILGGEVCGNSGAASGTYHGINFAAGATKFSVIGVKAGTAVGFGASQGYGVAVQSGASDNYRISLNDVTGNVTGGILDLGTGTTKRVFGNIGTGGTLVADQVPGTAWGLDFTPSGAIGVAASGTYDIATGSGIVALQNDSTGALGLFLCFAGGVTKVAGDATMVVGTAGASQIGLAYNAGAVKYRVSNGYASTQNIYITTLRTRPAS